VDPRGNACRPGREGELYIGGPGVARGYFGDPKLTAAKFTADPDAQSGGRVYRTGDLVRLRSDGDLEFIGRTDRQTNIGANRIEPGEIENVLNGHDKIQQAHVTTHEMPDGSHSVIAYCVSPPSAAPEQPKVLARWLRQRLPSVMVPHKFIFVREFPLTANGKIDATRLGANHSTTAMPAPSRHDRSKIESTLIRIWEELLNVSGARLDDSFADLGGDSLRLIRLQSLVKHAFGERVSVAELIRADRMADLVQLISDRVSGFTTPRGDTLRRPVGRLKQRR
jgi:acyl carrier protein